MLSERSRTLADREEAVQARERHLTQQQRDIEVQTATMRKVCAEDPRSHNGTRFFNFHFLRIPPRHTALLLVNATVV